MIEAASGAALMLAWVPLLVAVCTDNVGRWEHSRVWRWAWLPLMAVVIVAPIFFTGMICIGAGWSQGPLL